MRRRLTLGRGEGAAQHVEVEQPRAEALGQQHPHRLQRGPAAGSRLGLAGRPRPRLQLGGAAAAAALLPAGRRAAALAVPAPAAAACTGLARRPRGGGPDAGLRVRRAAAALGAARARERHVGAVHPPQQLAVVLRQQASTSLSVVGLPAKEAAKRQAEAAEGPVSSTSSHSGFAKALEHFWAPRPEAGTPRVTCKMLMPSRRTAPGRSRATTGGETDITCTAQGR